MNKSLNLSLAFASLGVCCVQTVQADVRPDKPNVLIILTDDLGWQDLQCYDIDEPTPYETPNLNQFAKEGVMFWQAYSPAPTSAPSRGAILSGKHPARLQRTHVVGGGIVVPRSEKTSTVMTPWYSGRLSTDNVIIPELLKPEGYVTGHSGKWHIAIDHNAYPQPKDHGFDYTRSDRGANTAMDNRYVDFATTQGDDPYRLDENGYPRDQNNIDALNFLSENKDKPFFLYYATWLVHSPIQTRAKWLLEKYSKKLGIPVPDSSTKLIGNGQCNPFFASMVEMMDYYIGQVLDYLRETDDPRWKGHKLIENTYVIFTSDNGGCMGSSAREVYTCNAPLDKGKIYVEEGGIRVPLMISGPGIARDVQTDVLASGMDFLPTIMSWTKTTVPSDLVLDGADLSAMLVKDPKDAKLVKTQDGQVRNSIMHHFPHSRMHSSIRVDGYKLIHNFSPDAEVPLELYQLYDENNQRVDIEEAKNLAAKMPEKAQQMDKLLIERLEAMDASFPYNNPYATFFKDQAGDIAEVVSNGQKGNMAWLEYKENGNKVTKAYILYTLNGSKADEEWFRLEAQVKPNGRVEVELPKGTTHYIFGLVDDQNFWLNFPNMGVYSDYKTAKMTYATNALKVE